MNSSDHKQFSEVKSYLTTFNEDITTRKCPSFKGFSYGLFPAMPKNSCDEIEPGLWIGIGEVAKNIEMLKDMKVTHVMNACMGNKFNQIDTNASYYEAVNIAFFGIPAFDLSSFHMSPYFRPAADFIQQALDSKGVIYVHCQLGVSRSASVVIAYYMLKRNMDFITAVKHVRQRREIFPNDGFLKQLILLGKEISLSGN